MVVNCYTKFRFNQLNTTQVTAIDIDLFLENNTPVYFHRRRQWRWTFAFLMLHLLVLSTIYIGKESELI